MLDQHLKNIYFDTPQILHCSRSILMHLLPPVDLTGEVSMIKKLFLGEISPGDLPIFSLIL